MMITGNKSKPLPVIIRILRFIWVFKTWLLRFFQLLHTFSPTLISSLYVYKCNNFIQKLFVFSENGQHRADGGGRRLHGGSDARRIRQSVPQRLRLVQRVSTDAVFQRVFATTSRSLCRRSPCWTPWQCLERALQRSITVFIPASLDPGGIVIASYVSRTEGPRRSGFFWGVDSHQLGGLGSGVSSPSGVWAEPQPKSNFVHFSRESWHLKATIK